MDSFCEDVASEGGLGWPWIVEGHGGVERESGMRV